MAKTEKDTDWWRGAVFYQIYPRSFMDSNGDGVGDLPGITDKLSYVAELGVDAIWISPFFKSPMADFGYDVSDYLDVDPIFGANEDFDILLRKAHQLGLKVIIDMVLSHTSDKHPWFVESRRDKTNSKADWYVWADPKPDGSPPSNWMSQFGGPAWRFDTHRGQYYLHNFLKKQPDLNFHNPEVQEAVLDTCRYWLERGVDGFRLDVVNFYFHDKKLRDNPPRGKDAVAFATQFERLDPYNMQAHIYDKSRPENLKFLKRLRRLMNSYGATMTVGEVGDDHPYMRATEYSEGTKFLNTTYNTHIMSGTHKELNADLIRKPLEEFILHNDSSWPSWAFSNHDVVRTVSRWGRGYNHDYNSPFAKMLIAALTSLHGTIFMYQGEELGLPEADIPFERLRDPWGKYAWPEWQGRDGCRTPMPWKKKERNAGFSHTDEDTWLPIPESHYLLAVDKQNKEEDSVLKFTRAFLKWRKEQKPLIKGCIRFISTGNDQILAFVREFEKQKILCVFNLGDKQARAENLPACKPCEDYPATGKTGTLKENGHLDMQGYGIFFGTLV